MNPPYSGNLHLKILREAMQHSDDIVCLHPIEQYISRRLVFDKSGLKNASFNDFIHCKSIETVNGSYFDAHIGNTLGISVWDNKNKYDTSFDRFVNITDLEKDIIHKIYKKIKRSNLYDMHVTSKKYVLNISPLHGNIGKKDWLYVVPMTYERALQVKDHNVNCQHCNPTFDSDEERHNFYNSLFLKAMLFSVRCWKTDLRVLYKYLPWLGDYTHPWTDADLYEYFSLNEEEVEIIENAIIQ